MAFRHVACIALLAMSGLAHAQVNVYAAGSLRAPLMQVAAEFEREPGGTGVALVFGASGLLRDRIARGDPAQVFASANTEHPQALFAAGGWQPVQVFARNALCALTRRGTGLTSANLVARLLDPAVKVGTSTPRADPSGDYAFALFGRIAVQPGVPADARQRLEAKALQLTGGPNSPPPPADRNVYGMLVADGQADIFITYCTNAALAHAENPQLERVDIAPEINVGADYGVTVRAGTGPTAEGFVRFLLSARGQAVLNQAGFLPPSPP